ncbi:unnamed protein product [Symbiodinium pilosum]|uniref:Uncharacterized protein n=1 Tax=Symbiodinium pilosum TaxID=2952 RepID=A0A812VRF2_SYMPI|nr:unnamed protein product [Symbiodinium pilosum]
MLLQCRWLLIRHHILLQWHLQVPANLLRWSHQQTHSQEKLAVIRGTVLHLRAVLTFVMDQVWKHLVREKRFARTLRSQSQKKFLVLMDACISDLQMEGAGPLTTPLCFLMTLLWCVATGNLSPWYHLAQTRQLLLQLWQTLALLAQQQLPCQVQRHPERT